jgi:hypothetical protein
MDGFISINVLQLKSLLLLWFAYWMTVYRLLKLLNVNRQEDYELWSGRNVTEVIQAAWRSVMKLIMGELKYQTTQLAPAWEGYSELPKHKHEF